MRTVEEFVKVVETGRIFSATFRKRTDNSIRVMNCRWGVKKHETGEGLSYDPKAKGLLPVYDMQIGDGKAGYRQIPLDGLLSVKIGGATYNYVEGEFHETADA